MIDDAVVADLLEMFMESSGLPERWITVYEFRTRFQLDEDSAHVIAGFLRRLHHNTLFVCQYRVEKIEKIRVNLPQPRMMRRYLVRKRLSAREKRILSRKTGCRNVEKVPEGGKK